MGKLKGRNGSKKNARRLAYEERCKRRRERKAFARMVNSDLTLEEMAAALNVPLG